MTATPRSRRRVLRAGLTAGGLLVTAPAVLTGCSVLTPGTPDAPDPLESPARRAEADVTLARAVADGHPDLAPAATAYAADRQAHAAALRAELRRVNPEMAPSSSAAPAPGVRPAFADGSDAGNALAAATGRAQNEAAALVAVLPGYRAALLASIAACCASHAVVLA